jgi:hypothetical protein
MKKASAVAALLSMVAMLFLVPAAMAHKLRVKAETVAIADSSLMVTPPRDWNRLGQNIGKNAETWTLDGEQLNDLTFYAGIAPGKPLVKERSKKKDPLPKFQKTTLLVEVPELLEGTYRTVKKIGAFKVTGSEPTPFLGAAGVFFTYEYTDEDQITRKGEARAAIVAGNLYMISFDAPRLYYFDKTIADARALVATAKL